MIDFVYDQKKETEIFKDFTLKKKSQPVAEMIDAEMSGAKIDPANTFILDQIKIIKSNWQIVSENFYKKLTGFYGVDVNDPDLVCLLTRTEIFPYNYQATPKWFAAPLFGSPAERNGVIMHELCHYFQPVTLPREIKEAIPVILNDHEIFKMYGYDRGHNEPNEQKWRKIIFDLYRQGKSFSEIRKIAGF